MTTKFIRMFTATAFRLAAFALAFGLGSTAWGAEATTIQNAAGESITVYVVADGFYQSAETYGKSTDFYITSKAGLLYFRTLVNADDGGVIAGAYGQVFFPNQTAIQLYTNNIFNGKTVHLLTDVDLENEDWAPIGYVHYDFNNGESKTYFYGSFNGHNHVISNVKIVRMANNQSRPDKYWKNFGSYGLFGYVSSNNPVFQNITIRNFTAICGENTLGADEYAGDYLGAFVGDSGSNPVTFRNCHVIGDVNIASSYVAGGIVGIGQVTVTECSVEATSGTGIAASTWAGGLVGAERGGNALAITGNTVSGIEVSSNPRTGSLVGAMALNVAGACAVTDNDIVDCVVNGEAATLETLFGPSTATTEMTYARNTVRTTLIVETGDLTPAEEITEETTAVNYTVPVTVKDRAGNVISETAEQEIAVSVGSEDVAEITLTSVKIDDVVMKAVESVGEDATSVTAIEIQVKASTEAEGEVQAITYEVHPEAIVTVSKTGEADATSTVQLSNTDLAADAEFSFELDVSSLTGISVGDQVRVTHSWDAYTDASGNAVAAGNETTLATVLEGKKVRITTKHFSSWTLEGITVAGETVAIVFAANGSEIAQYETVAGAIAANTTEDGCTVLVLDGTHDCGGTTITVDKSITLTGQSKAGTVLSFTASGSTAISVKASNVTIKDMTVTQASTGDDTFIIDVPRGGVYPNYTVAYSGVVMQNLILRGAKYAICVTADSFTVDGCEISGQSSNQILLYSFRGNSRICNNVFEGDGGNSDYTIRHESGNDGNAASYSAYGTLTISGNKASKSGVFYCFNQWGLVDTEKKINLIIAGNVITNFINKGINFYQGGANSASLAALFNEITITNNAFFVWKTDGTKRPVIRRDDGVTTGLTIDANYNYWGVADPDFSALAKTDNGVTPVNIDCTYWYNSFDHATGELSELRPLPKVAQIVGGSQYETLQAAVDAAADGDTIELLMDIQLSGTDKVTINKVGTYTIDGKGFSITPAADSAYIYDRFMFGESQNSPTYDSTKNYTVTNLTISGFTDSAYLVRAECCSLALRCCTLENNNLPYYDDSNPNSIQGSRVVLATAADLTLAGCVIRGNTTTFQTVDFNTNGGSVNSKGGTLTVDDCLFAGNSVGVAVAAGGNGVVYTYGSTSSGNVIKNSTFSGNTVNSTAAAVVYFSGVTDVTGCLFTNNSITCTSNGKCGVLALGSGAAGSAYSNNAFVANTLSSSSPYGTIYAGAKNVDLTGNYWGAGTAPVADTTGGADIYLGKTEGVVYSTYASLYAVNESGRGVTVKLPPDSVVVTEPEEPAAEGEPVVYTVTETTGGESVSRTVAFTVEVADAGASTLPAASVSKVYESALAEAFQGGVDTSLITNIEIAVTNSVVVTNVVNDAIASISNEVDLVAIVTLQDSGASSEAATETVPLTNESIPANTTFTFYLDCTGLAGVGDWVKVTHYSDDPAYPDPETQTRQAVAGLEEGAVRVPVTVSHFSGFLLEASTAPWATNSVQSANLLGAVKVTGTMSNMYVAVPFVDFGGASAAASNAVHAANLSDGTKLYAYDRENDRYNVYSVSSGAWAGMNKITVKSEELGEAGVSALGAPVAAGTGVILQRASESDAAYVYGEVPAAYGATTEFGSGKTLVCPPSTNAMAAVDLNAFSWSGVAATTDGRYDRDGRADFIQFRTPDNKLVQYYYEGGSWGVRASYASKYGAYVEGGKALIPAGTAFWYYGSTNTPHTATVTW